eukprot:2542695-Prymnesium_polylepis.1
MGGWCTGESAPGVARIRKTAHARLMSTLVTRSRQACGRTAPTVSEMCSGAEVCDQFHSDRVYEPHLNGYGKLTVRGTTAGNTRGLIRAALRPRGRVHCKAPRTFSHGARPRGASAISLRLARRARRQ